MDQVPQATTAAIRTLSAITPRVQCGRQIQYIRTLSRAGKGRICMYVTSSHYGNRKHPDAEAPVVAGIVVAYRSEE